MRRVFDCCRQKYTVNHLWTVVFSFMPKLLSSFYFWTELWHENRSFVILVKVHDDKLKIKAICMGFCTVAKQHRKKSKQASDSVREQKWEAAAEKRGWEEAGMKEILPFSWWWCASFCETLYFGWLGTKKQSISKQKGPRFCCLPSTF